MFRFHSKNHNIILIMKEKIYNLEANANNEFLNHRLKSNKSYLSSEGNWYPISVNVLAFSITNTQ